MLWYQNITYQNITTTGTVVKNNSEHKVQVCIEASARLYRAEKKASLLHFLI